MRPAVLAIIYIAFNLAVGIGLAIVTVKWLGTRNALKLEKESREWWMESARRYRDQRDQLVAELEAEKARRYRIL